MQKQFKVERDDYQYTVDGVLFYSKQVYDIGKIVQVSGQCSTSKASNFTSFNYEKFLFSKKIKCVIYEPKIKVVGKNYYYDYRSKIQEYVSKTDVVGLKQKIILGVPLADSKISQVVTNLQLSHLLALSGLHLALIMAVVTKFCNKVFNKEYITIMIVLIVITLYALTIMYSYSIIRTLLIFYLALITKLCKIPISNFNRFLIVVNIMLFNGYAIYSTAFIFSCLAYSVILLTKQYQILKIYFLITLLLLPLIINLNNQVGILGIILSPLLTIIFEIIYFPYLVITTILAIPDYVSRYVINFLQILDYYNYQIIISDFKLTTMVIYYVSVLYCLCFSIKRVIFISLCFCFIVSLMTFKQVHTLYFLDVGQGDCILIVLSDKTTILIDSGRSSTVSEYMIIPLLKDLGIRKLDYIIVSHGDLDHLGGMNHLVANFKYGQLFINCNDINALEQALNGKVLNDYTISSDNYNLHFSCVNRDTENDSSIVLEARLNNYYLLSLGDLSGEYELLYEQPVDILKVSHHGSITSTFSEFVNNINPKYGIISVGKNNYGHPSTAVLNNLAKTKVYDTLTYGAIKVVVSEQINVITKLKGD